MIFDTHAHYDDARYDEDRDELLSSLKNGGVGALCNVSSDVESLDSSVALAEKYDFIYAAVGIHPSDCAEMDDTVIRRIKDLAAGKKVVAIGEIGLDYYWPEPDHDIQKKWFERQLNLARELKMPVIIHSREAAEDTYDMMKALNAGDIGGVVHCFSYDVSYAKKYLDMGFFIGIGGVVTFKNAAALKEVAGYVPLSSIVLETDCPYLAPVPHRGERNSSLYLSHVADEIAGIKNISRSEVEEATWENAHKLYGI
ncbi:MAG: TatD family hydrolase [Lachnospiraceae bacterium]|nr:TatD family hydrolase [Lachnospiraceae bacterium]